MKPYLFHIIAFLFLLLSPHNSNSQVSTDVVIGHTHAIQSKILGELRDIKVYLPLSFSNDSTLKYPVIYLLDGDVHFHSLTGIVHYLSRQDVGVIPEMVIIAISTPYNSIRARDLTPTKMKIDLHTGDPIQYENGGGEKFMDFMEKELIPFVDQKYRTSKLRTFIGHSFGGLTVVNTLVNRKDMFTNYIAIDPSLWWDYPNLVNAYTSELKKPIYEGKSLYLSTQISVSNPSSVSQKQLNMLRLDTSRKTMGLRSKVDFMEMLSKHKANRLNYKGDFYQDDSHMSVPLISEYTGLRFLFNWHKFKVPINYYFETDSDENAEEIITLLNQHFTRWSSKMGVKNKPQRRLVNHIGNELMWFEKPKMAGVMFELNVQNFPKNANANEAMGDYYLAVSDTLNAINYFEKAIEFGDEKSSKSSKEKLKKLKLKN